MKLFKQPMFLIGFLFIGLLLVGSLGYYFIFHDKVPTEPLLLMKNGKVLGQSPYSPLELPPFGSDLAGKNYGILILIGARYTLGIGLLIALFRVVMSIVIGIVYGLFFYRFKSAVTGILDGFHYIPLTLLAYLLLSPVLIMDFYTETYQYSIIERLAFEGLLLALIAVPIVAVNIGNEIGEHMRREYITSAKVLGARRLHILIKHVTPHLLPKVIYIVLQQTVQVLLVLAHLGILQLFLGGTDKIGHPPETFSHSGEWSGLIGQNYITVSAGAHTWLVFGPLIMLVLSIIAISFMAEGFKKATAPVFGKRGVKVKQVKEVKEQPANPYSFEPVRKHVKVLG